MLKGNKGEWSELYVLISLLAEGKLHQSDIELNKDPNNIYEVTKGYKNETDYSLTFNREKDEINISKIEKTEETFIQTISINKIKQLSEDLYNGIINSKGRSFSIDNVNNRLSDLCINKLKEKSQEKADIRLKIYDHRLAKETDLGFSIKSLIGGNSTLFNAGNGNNFIFDIYPKTPLDISQFNKDTYSSPTRESKITYRLNSLLALDSKIKYCGVQSFQLWKNLKMIDGDLPEILAYALFFRWSKSTSSLKAVSETLEKEDPMNFYNGKPSDQKLYEYKITRFLTECAMGMTPEVSWQGNYDKFGGVIVAKEDGDIVAFHIYDFNLFREYLINNTMFEQPSTGEDKNNPGNRKIAKGVKKYYYGWLYDENDNYKFKINLQIRFK